MLHVTHLVRGRVGHDLFLLPSFGVPSLEISSQLFDCLAISQSAVDVGIVQHDPSVGGMNDNSDNRMTALTSSDA